MSGCRKGARADISSNLLFIYKAVMDLAKTNSPSLINWPLFQFTESNVAMSNEKLPQTDHALGWNPRDGSLPLGLSFFIFFT